MVVTTIQRCNLKLLILTCDKLKHSNSAVCTISFSCFLSVLVTSQVLMKVLDFQFDIFNPLAIPPSDFLLLVELDALVDAGISPAQFQGLFAQCSQCQVCITRRNLSHHSCKTALSSLPANSVGDRNQLLHCVRSDGLPVARFEAVFIHCISCNRIMTNRASTYHDCVGDALRFKAGPGSGCLRK